jgi:RHS repeat-associated protein
MISVLRQLAVLFLSITLAVPLYPESASPLGDASAAVTDTYDYDAYGNLIHSTGTTPNNYLFASEQFDPDLGLYYNRARYLNASTGRFWSMDTKEGNDNRPLSLHKYLYASADPVGQIDPSGNDGDLVTLAEEEPLLIEGDALESEAALEETVITQPPPAAAPPAVSAPPPTIPGTPATFGSLVGRAVVTLTALALAGSLVSDNPLPPTQPRTGNEDPYWVYRDASGPSPSDFRVDMSKFSTTGFEVSTLKQPKRNKRYVVPFLVTYNRDQGLVEGSIGVVADPGLRFRSFTVPVKGPGTGVYKLRPIQPRRRPTRRISRSTEKP